MVRKAAKVLRRISQTDHSETNCGFSLIEMLCVLAIISMAAALVLPALKEGVAEMPSLALAAGEILKSDRNTALLTGKIVRTIVDSSARFVRSGAGGRTLSIPTDVEMQTLLADQCGATSARREIQFFPDGLSCGGVIRLVKSGQRYEIRVNWLTGTVDVGSSHD
jgi:general secretion pathway protein H